MSHLSHQQRRHTLVIGLDCAAPELVFDAWRTQLPTLDRLLTHGRSARLESCVPAITVPAWACMMSSQDPGQLGIYGFRNRADYSYDNMTIATARALKAPRLWDLLGDAGSRVGVVGVPLTYPVQPVNGELVSCFLTPGAHSQYTFPPALKTEIAAWLDDQLLMDVPNFRTTDKAALLADIYRMSEQHWQICERLLQQRRYDFFMTVDMGVDRMHHAFWKEMDPRHPKHVPGSPFAEAILDYYRYVDRRIGELLELVDERTAVMVVSDHGGKAMLGGVCLNEWLIREGYLVLEEYPTQPVPLERCRVDWRRTRAWGSGGYYGRLFLNVAGREPHGCVRAADYASLRDEIAAKLQALPDHQGRPLATRVWRPEALYRRCDNVPPDLLIYFGDLDWRSVGSVGTRELYTFDNDTGPDDANHAQHGIWIWYDPQRPAGGQREDDISIYDIAPTLLAWHGQPIPPAMIGRARDV